MFTHSSILAWRILWTEEPGGPQSMGSQGVGYDRLSDYHTHTHTHTHTHSLPSSASELSKIKTSGRDLLHCLSYLASLTASSQQEENSAIHFFFFLA